MNMTQTPNRIHPLLAAAAVSVTLVSLVGIAAMTDVLPKSHSTSIDASHQTGLVYAAPAPLVATPVKSALEAPRSKPVVHQTSQAVVQRPAQQPARHYSAAPSQPPAAKVTQNSPVGIGVGAVVGGLLGNQVGGGNGKTLATIVGAVGGGYLGNEIAKKNQ
ncbi:MAG: glycine zipper 2TM domain-containing protein [Rhodoferax sp.]|uniref:glycine zipper 2TM domain-containing protein n=1 Tax=Rhodoferax sp. TaxID=50421 RepID=UPI00260DF87B|nr:glycine zipper 2TM domain-containing protein [Rhodoferax sp.]MDD2881317.1 glycine zipper 2TM domain-containing protein [Rhodoferax sp.]